MTEIEQLVKRVSAYNHVLRHEINPADLEELFRCADRHYVRVLAERGPSGRVVVNLKKKMGSG